MQPFGVGYEMFDITCVDYKDKEWRETITVQYNRYISEISAPKPDTLCVTFENVPSKSVLMWFNDTVTSTVLDYEITVDDISCVPLVENNTCISGLTANVTYTFCVIENGLSTVSPFDCAAFFLPPPEADDLNGMWISADNQTPFILIASGVFIIFMWIGIILGVYVIRRYPNWLKGAKNLVIVDSDSNTHRKSDDPSIEDNTAIPYR